MHDVVLIRHGQSRWNLENRFTGWVDVDLSPAGEAEARAAAQLLRDEGMDFDVCYTSVLKRAIRTLWFVLEGLDRCWLPVHRSWRLNERHYGALAGLDKKETAQKHGAEQVHRWRRGFAVRPPELEPGDSANPAEDRRYANLAVEDRPRAESLEDTIRRVLPCWEHEIAPRIRAGERVLVAAHGNSLRALVKHLDRLSEDEIMETNIPTGVPLLYRLDGDLDVLERRYLGDPEQVAAAAAAVAAQAGGG